MSGAVREGFVRRGEDAGEERMHRAAVRGLERERRIKRLSTICGPVGLIAVLTALVVSDRYERAKHPFPEPEIRVAVLRGASAITPAKPIKDLNETEETIALANTITGYVVARESYCFTCVAENTTHVKAISAPDERARYSAVVDNDKDPQNPKVLYGTGLYAGTVVVDPTKVEITESKDSPNSFSAIFPVAIYMPNKPPQYITKVATMSWLPAGDVIKQDMKQAYSPLGIGCWSYNSYSVRG